jgi:hypothetical protein
VTVRGVRRIAGAACVGLALGVAGLVVGGTQLAVARTGPAAQATQDPSGTGSQAPLATAKCPTPPPPPFRTPCVGPVETPTDTPTTSGTPYVFNVTPPNSTPTPPPTPTLTPLPRDTSTAAPTPTPSPTGAASSTPTPTLAASSTSSSATSASAGGGGSGGLIIGAFVALLAVGGGAGYLFWRLR